MTRCWGRSMGRTHTSFEKERKKKKNKHHLEIFPYGLVRKRERKEKADCFLLSSRQKRMFVLMNRVVAF